MNRPSGMIRLAQPAMYACWVLALVMFFVVGMYVAGTMNPAFMAVGMFIISPVMMTALRESFEGPVRPSFFNPKVMSFGFVFGDFVILPIGFWFAARGWQSLTLTSAEFTTATALSAGTGVATMIGFMMFDGARYRKAGWGASLLSPTKSWHDMVVMPVVSALTVWLMVPQIVAVVSFNGRHGSPESLLYATLSFGVFMALCGQDMRTPPDPRHQHYRWNPKKFRPIGTI